MRMLLSLVSLCVTRRGSLPARQQVLQRHAAVRRMGAVRRRSPRAQSFARLQLVAQPAPFQSWRGGLAVSWNFSDGLVQGHRRDNPSACVGNCRTPWRKHRTAPAFLLSAGTAYFPQSGYTRHAPPSLSVKYRRAVFGAQHRHGFPRRVAAAFLNEIAQIVRHAHDVLHELVRVA